MVSALFDEAGLKTAIPKAPSNRLDPPNATKTDAKPEHNVPAEEAPVSTLKFVAVVPLWLGPDRDSAPAQGDHSATNDGKASVRNAAARTGVFKLPHNVSATAVKAPPSTARAGVHDRTARLGNETTCAAVMAVDVD